VPETVQFVYHPDHSPSLSDRCEAIVEERWDTAVDQNSDLFNAPGFTLLEVTDNRIHLGPTQFKYQFVRRLLLSGDRTDLPNDLVDELQNAVQYVSSFVAVIAQEELVVGIKEADLNGETFLSLPGSGYLDRNDDLEDTEMMPTADIVEREIREEINITDPDEIRCIGVFEDLSLESHLNPALFSIVSTEMSPTVVQQTATTAEDADEFSEFVTVQLSEQAVSGLIQFGVDDSTAMTDVDCLPDLNVTQCSHKTLLMVLLVGRHLFGSDWFAHQRDQYPSITFENSVSYCSD
jgi:ADP-ribose pyrophosphatase YjhB (NUDIX family)